MTHGRDQLGPMERLTQILSLLSTGRTLTADQVLEVVAYGSDSVEDRRDQLRRDVRHLESLGWDIANVAEPGEQARYRLTAVDNRLRVEFTPQQRFQLLRAAHAAGLSRLVDDLGGGAATETDFEAAARPGDAALAGVQRAVARHCVLHFTYKGRRRDVHPHALHVRPGGWYLTAVEVGTTDAKTFAVARMTDVELSPAGSAPVPDRASRPQLDPITWRVDPAVDVVVQTSREHRPQVESMLGRAHRQGESADDPALLTLTIAVTHRAAFRRRLYELGTRVRLLGPEEIRDEVGAELRAVAGVS